MRDYEQFFTVVWCGSTLRGDWSQTKGELLDRRTLRRAADPSTPYKLVTARKDR